MLSWVCLREGNTCEQQVIMRESLYRAVSHIYMYITIIPSLIIFIRASYVLGKCLIYGHILYVRGMIKAITPTH